MNRRRFTTTLVGSLAASGFAGRALAQTPSADTRQIDDMRGTQTIPANPQAVLALGEEFLLADLLELGIKPIAAAGNYPDVYVGIDQALTEGLEPFSLWEMDIEQLSLLEMDLILVPEIYYTSQSEGFDMIGELAPMVVLPNSGDWRENFAFLASVFGKEDEAASKVADLDAEIEQTTADLSLDGQTVTFATIYPAASELTLWLTDGQAFVEIGQNLGLTVVPDAANFEPDPIGRVRISLEQVTELQGDTLIMMQTTGGLSEEEDASYKQLTESPTFKSIPAAQNGRVFVWERVGFPGDVPGRRNLLAKYRETFS